VLVEDAVALGLADLLDDDLLGRLGGDPAEVGRVDLLAVGEGGGLAGLPVDLDLDVFGVGEVLLGRRGQRRLDPLEKNLLGDVLVAVDAIDDPDQIDAQATPPGRNIRWTDGGNESRACARTGPARIELSPRRHATAAGGPDTTGDSSPRWKPPAPRRHRR